MNFQRNFFCVSPMNDGLSDEEALAEALRRSLVLEPAWKETPAVAARGCWAGGAPRGVPPAQKPAMTAPPTRALPTQPMITQALLVLVGLPGSGKSTLAADVLRRGGPQWARVNQDELGSRQACEAECAAALAAGRSVVVDRCNFDRRQRAVWLAHANLKGGGGLRARAICLFLSVPPEECARRAAARQGHPTVHAGNAQAVVGAMAAALEPPAAREGFQGVHVARSAEEAAAVLERIFLIV